MRKLKRIIRKDSADFYKKKIIFKALRFFENRNFAARVTRGHAAEIADFLELNS